MLAHTSQGTKELHQWSKVNVEFFHCIEAQMETRKRLRTHCLYAA